MIERRWRPSWLTRASTVVLSVALITVGSVAAVVATNSNDGEPTPDAAVHVMLTALARGDLLGALEALPPDERLAVMPYLSDLVANLQRLGLLPAVSLRDATGAGSALRLEGLTSSSVPVGQDIARVTITGGRLRGRVGSASLSEDLRRLIHDSSGVDPPSAGSDIDVDLMARRNTLLAVKSGGGWHVSIYETVVDLLRDQRTALPAWSGPPAAIGSATPGETVTDLWKAISDLDTSRVFNVVDPDEQRALYEALPLFLPELRRDAGRWVEDEGFGFPPPKVTVKVEGSGQERIVRITGFDAKWRDAREQLRVVYDGRCLTFEHRNTPDAAEIAPTIFSHCDGDVRTPIDPAVTGTRTHQLTVWTGLGRAFPSFVVRERAGRWYISPTRSAMLTLLETLRGLQPADAQAFVDRSLDVAHTFRQLPA